MYSGFLVCVFAITCTLFSSPRFVLNVTDSLPHGIYYVSKRSTYSRGDIVCFPIPAEVEPMVTGRGWLKKGHLMMKPIAALPGDEVCLNGSSLSINNEQKGNIRSVASEGRPLPRYAHCGPLGDDELFVANAADSKSFDSRYFGPIPKDEIKGRAQPIWIF